jgi:hypothetical protein
MVMYIFAFESVFSLAVNIATALIMVLLLSIYIKNYMHIKSKFNLGLILFSAMFIIENLLSIVFVFFTFYNEPIINIFNMIGDLVELVGAVILFLLTWE